MIERLYPKRPTWSAAGIWKITINGVMPAMRPMTVALAPKLSAYKMMGLSITIIHETKLKKKNTKR